jgi:hypothetical protein
MSQLLKLLYWRQVSPVALLPCLKCSFSEKPTRKRLGGGVYPTDALNRCAGDDTLPGERGDDIALATLVRTLDIEGRSLADRRGTRYAVPTDIPRRTGVSPVDDVPEGRPNAVLTGCRTCAIVLLRSPRGMRVLWLVMGIVGRGNPEPPQKPVRRKQASIYPIKHHLNVPPQCAGVSSAHTPAPVKKRRGVGCEIIAARHISDRAGCQLRAFIRRTQNFLPLRSHLL